MSYIPKTIKCKMDFKNITDEEIRKNCAYDSEVEGVRKFYEKLEGIELYLSLWEYDNYECYHLSTWKNEVDNTMMEAFWIFEKEFGVYDDYEEFKKDWEEGEYDSGGSIVFPKSCVEELEVICEESDEPSEREKLELLNSIEIVEYSGSCNECEYILVNDNQINRDILEKLGVNKETIEEECNPDGGYLDISSVAGRFATHYSAKKKIFCIDNSRY